jgi:hypothetical protein
VNFATWNRTRANEPIFDLWGGYMSDLQLRWFPIVPFDESADADELPGWIVTDTAIGDAEVDSGHRVGGVLWDAGADRFHDTDAI